MTLDRPVTVLGLAALVLAFWMASPALAADRGLDDYLDLRQIDAFGAISVSLHKQEAAGTEAAVSGLSEQELEDYVRTRFAAYFPGIPFRNASAAELADPGNATTLGSLACRIWADESKSPSVFQVRCYISTAAHRNIIEDGSYGYGPPDKVPEIVRQQIDYILGGFGGVFARLRVDG